MTKVVIDSTIAGIEQAVGDLQADYPGIDFVFCPDRSQLIQEVRDADVYLGAVGRAEVLAARQLKWVQSISTGVNNMLAIPELVDSDILLCGARGTHSAALAESVFGMILAFTRGIRESIFLQQQHRWDHQQALRGRQVELTGSTLGLVGYGALSRALAKRAQAFDMRIIAVDLYPADSPTYVTLQGLDHLDDLLRQSDYLVVTVPGGPATKGMIGAREIALMKPGSLLVGISRGGVINQSALAQGLRQGPLAAAALDVCDPEPLPADNELWDLPNLLLTPHIAGGTQYEAESIIRIFRANLDRFQRGELPLINQVDREKGF